VEIHRPGKRLVVPDKRTVPRWYGDVSDPRGGVRWVIPGRADYWSKP
jgi:hypothetical protein